MLLTFAPSFDVGCVRKAFTWGDWKQAPRYTGTNIVTRSDGSILVQQDDFLSKTVVRSVSMRNRESEVLSTPQELSEFRSVTGSLQWLAGSTRPDLSAATSLLQGPSPSVPALRALYEHTEYAQQTADCGIVVNKIDLTRACFVAYGDSSFTDASECKSQAGLMVILVDQCVLREAQSETLFDWKSHRTRRIVRSTLAVEAAA
eukprot:2083578-Amphidinium_carterae.2